MASPSRTFAPARLPVLASLVLAGSSWAVVAPVETASAAPTGSVSAVSSAQTITLTRTSAQRVESGRKARFSGTTPASMRGKRIVLQRKGGGGGWKVVGAARVSGSGTYAVSGKAKGAGANAFRTYVVTRVTKKGKKRVERRAYSAKRSLWSLDWFHLFDSNRRSSRNFNRYVADVGGAKYRKSFGPRSGAGNGWVQVNLGGACDAFRGHVGQDDVSERGTTSRFLVSMNGAETDLGVKARGKARPIAFDVTGVSTLRLSSQREAGAGRSWAIWANPRVLCQRRP